MYVLVVPAFPQYVCIPSFHSIVVCWYVAFAWAILAAAAVVGLQEAKSETVSQQRMALLMPRSSAAAAARPRADVVIQVKTGQGYKQVRTHAGRAWWSTCQSCPCKELLFLLPQV